ncbi:hypothetical protein [Lysinibacillus irui]|uniref:hypothetical protein n=1 Tax=Lysinibacillus irui TaxID=2998077 RepID=UPI002AD3DDF3|nr:hypothetical protein [Lysinibacillus irui]MEA0564556.1 hypothetical protein [Lysinibacillus irui]
MTKFNVGDKVVPLSKTVDWDTLNRVKDHLDESGTWNRALSNEQTFLYVNRIDKFRNLYICSNECGGGGDYFHESDLTPYKTKPTKNQRITALEDTVAKQSEEISELKLIVHELRGKKSIEPSTTTTVEGYVPKFLDAQEDLNGIIEFEGQQYRKVDRGACEGDVVTPTRGHSAFLTQGKMYRVVGDGRVIDNYGHAIPLYTGWEGRTRETVDVYELIKEGLNPQIPMIDETIEPLTPNQQRFLTIINAKRFVAERQAVMLFGHVDFIVNTEKRTIVALLKPLGSNQVVKRGIAKCDPNDVFNEHIGKAIALGRALGLDVSEFEQAVQPTVAVGQLLGRSHTLTDPTRWKVDDLNDTGKNLTIINNEFESLNGETADGGYLPDETWYKIVEDTNAKYEEG